MEGHLYYSFINMVSLVMHCFIFFQALRIKPPMCVTKEDADFGVEIFRKALQNATSKK